MLLFHQPLAARIILELPPEVLVEPVKVLTDSELLEKYGFSPDVDGVSRFLRWAQGEGLEDGHVDKLVASLGHEEFRQREAATAELCRLGYLPSELLEEAKKSPDPEIVNRATRVLAQRATLEADRTRLFSISLGLISTEKLKVPTELLLRMPPHLKDDSQKVAWTAAISGIVTVEDTEWLQKALMGKDPLLKETAMRALPRANPELAIKLLRPLVDDSGDVGSWSAARGLVELGDRLVWKHLVAWTASDDRSIRIYGLQLLRASTGQNFKLDVFEPHELQTEQRLAWSRWLGEQGDLSISRLPLRHVPIDLYALEEDIANHLIAHFSMEHVAGGKLVDQSSAGKDGSLRGAHRSVDGMDGKAIHFRGLNSTGTAGGHAELPFIDFNELKEFTVALWVKHEDTTDDHGEAFVCYGFDQGSTFDGSVCIGSFFDQIQFRTGTGMITIPQPPEDLGRWIHYAMSYRDGVLRAYKNGEKAGEKKLEVAVKGNKAALAQHWWANGSMTSTRFIGAMDELRVYDRALGPIDIKQLGPKETVK